MAGMLRPSQWRHDLVDACAQPIHYQKEDAGEAIESGGFLEMFSPWRYSRKLKAALLAEFVGMAIFQIYGGNSPDSVAAFGNGITLVVLVYATAHVSGGHLNPAVTFAQCLTGHSSWKRGGLYAAAQLLGAIWGALVQAMIMPGVRVGHGDGGPGCFTPTHEPAVTNGQLFGWELIMTFTLVSVVYAAAVAKPGHGNCAPLAIGFTLFASAFVGGPYSGAALNPARVLGPSLVFHCYWSTVPVYIFAQLLGALIAALSTMPLYGFGPWVAGGPAASEPEGPSQEVSLLPKTAPRSDAIQLTAIASGYDPTPARRGDISSAAKSVSFREAGPLSEVRPSLLPLPPLPQTGGYAAVGGGGGGYKSLARPPDVRRPNTPNTPNTPSTPGSAGRAGSVPRTAEADRKDWQTSFTDRRT